MIKEKLLDFIPLKITYFPCSQYILVAGSNKQCLLLSHDGIQLAEIGSYSSWTWCCAVHPESKQAVNIYFIFVSFYLLYFDSIYIDRRMSRWNSCKY